MSRINKPYTKGVAKKTPVIMQLEALECGAASLAMILSYYGKWIPLEQVRVDCGVSRDGSSASNILKAAENYGLNADAYAMDVEDFAQDGQYPCIIHWNFNHFVVLKGFKGKYAYINDPARGDVKVPMSEFDECFTGVCLMFEPGEGFTPFGKKKSTLDFIKERSKGLRLIITFSVLLTCTASLLSVIEPGFVRVLYDRILSGKDLAWANGFLIFFCCFSALRVLVSILDKINSVKINAKLAVVGSSSFMWKILRLPMSFFSQRMIGDILSRQNSNADVASTIVNTLSPLLINSAMMIFYFIVMIRYSIVLTAISVAATLINALFSLYISNKRMNATRIALRDTGKLSATTVSGIESIETIKSAGAENGFFEKWSGYQASANNAQVKYTRTSLHLGLIPQIVSTLCSVAIMAVGLYFTVKGEFTLGMISAFQGYSVGFTKPADTLITAGQTLQEMRTQLERIDDVMRYPNDFLFEEKNIPQAQTYEKLSGNVEIKNVTFGYSRLSEPQIKNFNLTLKPGSRVALVGSSGCGKSTLSKLISGIEQPWNGEILFDGKHICEIDRSVFTGSLSVVDQEITLFEDSIKSNIKMWDSTIEDFEAIMAARDAQIHDDIMQRDGGYDYQLSEGGRNFSGGQKQRIEIARILAQDPTICILDEATSALDAKTEYEVIKSIKDRGITCIIIAHRLSTIRDCDEIIVLEKGVAVERGTHEELMSKGGYYTRLITSD